MKKPTVMIYKKCKGCKIAAYQVVMFGHQIRTVCRCGGDFECTDKLGKPILTEVVWVNF